MNPSPAEILIQSAVKTVGKREFLKTVERLFPTPVAVKRLPKEPVQGAGGCQARVKGERTGIKAGRHVLFDAQRCPRASVEGGLCCIHRNQKARLGELPLGLASAPLTESQRKVFGEI
jgi:hypothetical protein